MKVNKTKLGLGTVSLLVVALLGFGIYYGVTNTSKDKKEARSVIISTDYKTYDSVDALARDSDVVVIAKAVSVGPTTLEKLEGAPSDEEAKKAGKEGSGSYPTTPVSYRVSRVIRGQSKVGDTMKTNELGGIVNGVDYKIEGQELKVVEGNSYLLFLSVDDTGVLSLLPAGPQAKYLVENEMIRSFSSDPEGVEKQLHGMKVEDLVNLIR